MTIAAGFVRGEVAVAVVGNGGDELVFFRGGNSLVLMAAAGVGLAWATGGVDVLTGGAATGTATGTVFTGGGSSEGVNVRVDFMGRSNRSSPIVSSLVSLKASYVRNCFHSEDFRNGDAEGVQIEVDNTELALNTSLPAPCPLFFGGFGDFIDFVNWFFRRKLSR